MKTFLVLSLFVVNSVVTVAQSTRDSVIATVHQLFEGMKTADTLLLKKSFSQNAILQTIKDTKGVISVRDESIADFIGFVGKETAGSADERIAIGSVQIDGPLAMVWTPYQFFYKGQFSHCGVNVFQLVRFNDGWKIQYIIDTRRKTGCL